MNKVNKGKYIITNVDVKYLTKDLTENNTVIDMWDFFRTNHISGKPTLFILRIVEDGYIVQYSEICCTDFLYCKSIAVTANNSYPRFTTNWNEKGTSKLTISSDTAFLDTNSHTYSLDIPIYQDYISFK